MELINKFSDELENLRIKLDDYIKVQDRIINAIKEKTVRTVYTRGSIYNFTPFFEECLGDKCNGKIISGDNLRDDDRRYSYDSENRVIMIEKYSSFLNMIRIDSIFLYHGDSSEQILFSGSDMCTLKMLLCSDGKCKYLLTYGKNNPKGQKKSIQEFIYLNDTLAKIYSQWENGKHWIQEFYYKNDKLILIRAVADNGFSMIDYSTARPDFKKIRELIYYGLLEKIKDRKNNFTAIGIEGFLDQNNPHFCVCFDISDNQSEYLAEWDEVSDAIELFDFYFNDSQMKKCVKIIAEVIIQLFNEGKIIKNKFYFHQSQVSIQKLYRNIRKLFLDAGIEIL